VGECAAWAGRPSVRFAPKRSSDQTTTSPTNKTTTRQAQTRGRGAQALNKAAHKDGRQRRREGGGGGDGAGQAAAVGFIYPHVAGGPFEAAPQSSRRQIGGRVGHAVRTTTTTTTTRRAARAGLCGRSGASGVRAAALLALSARSTGQDRWRLRKGRSVAGLVSVVQVNGGKERGSMFFASVDPVGMGQQLRIMTGTV
jgi:hypothetical protein